MEKKFTPRLKRTSITTTPVEPPEQAYIVKPVKKQQSIGAPFKAVTALYGIPSKQQTRLVDTSNK